MGLFSTVTYGSKSGTDAYHVEFKFHQAGMTVEESQNVGYFAGSTYLVIPMYEVYTFDGSAVMYLQGKPIYSIAKPEEYVCLMWLPLLPAGVFMNCWWGWHVLEKGSVNALCEAVAKEHCRRFLLGETAGEVPAR